MTDSVTLVFPALGNVAEDYLATSIRRSEKFVCAASVRSAGFPEEYGQLHWLPSINEADFEQRFLDLVREHGVTLAFCPVSTVYAYVEKLIARENLSIRLIGKSPVQQQIDQHRSLVARAKRLEPFVRSCADGAASIELLELASLLRQSSLIYGESNEDKLAATMGVFANAPKGDVVEIGSLMGRSASILIYLAWRYELGSILTVDPWSALECVQHDSPQSLQVVTDSWDYEVLREGFFVNTLPMRTRDHAHLRMPAESAFTTYSEGKQITSMFGNSVNYSQSIAVIHIDGNHDYQAVKKDCELWLTKLAPDSWLILDDYIWAHGDGPYRVGNSLLEKLTKQIDCSFVAGKALFVRFNSKLTPSMITAALAG